MLPAHILTYDLVMDSEITLKAQGLTPAPQLHQSNLRQRILVIDNDEYSRRLNAGALICSGYWVDDAEDGAIGWELLQINHYDLLVTDHNMPKLSGIELLQKLHAAHISLPCILATGTIPTQTLDQFPWLRIDATHLKPYDIEDFLETVKSILYKTVSASGDIASPPNWRSHPAVAVRNFA